MAAKPQPPPSASPAPRWEVVGGADKGGIVVREGHVLTSRQLPQKLATASVVEQLSRIGDRVRYRLASGQGPETGWVSIKLKDKALLEPRPTAAAAAAAAPPAPAAGAAGAELPEDGGRSDFERRLEDLRERYPGFEDPLPPDAASWSPADLENFVASGGYVKPQASTPAQAARRPPPPPPPAAAAEASPAALPDGQWPVAQAKKLLEQLSAAFGSKDFQDRLEKLKSRHPKRRDRGHPDGAHFFEAFQNLALRTYEIVLPKYGLDPSWEGISEMHERISSAVRASKEVRKRKEEINVLLGLPRDAVLRPPKRVEDSFVYRPDGDGEVPGYPSPLHLDEDGDEAHEFLVEDLDTGELLRLAG